MEQKPISVWKSSATSGVYIGIVLILISVIFYVSGNTFAKSSQYIGYVVMIMGVIYAQINFRKLLGGEMTYGQAFGAGVISMLFASILSGIYTYVLYKIIDPSLQEQLRLFTEEQIVKQGRVSEEQIDMAVEMAAKFQKPIMMLIFAIIGGTLIGLIISLITSIFTQKKPSEEIVE